jgi:Glycosyltransferase family 87
MIEYRPSAQAVAKLLRAETLQQRAALALGLLLLLVGLVTNWRNSQMRGEDFGHIFIISKSLLKGFDIYTAAPAEFPKIYREYLNSDWVPWGIFNPPSVGIALLPLAWLPYETAKVLYFFLSVTVLLAGVWRLMQLFTKDFKFHTRLLVLGAIFCSSGSRWGFFYLQAAPLIFGLLGLLLWELDKRREMRVFAICTLAILLKFTLFLPLAGVAFLKGRVLLLAAVGVAWVSANVVGFALLGGMKAVAGYRTNMAAFEQPDQLNYPDYRAPNSMQRLDWPYLLNAFSPDLPRSQILATVLSVLFVAWLIWEMYRAWRFAGETETVAAFLGPFVCLSMLCVYHHHYDAIALLAPVLVYVGRPAQRCDAKYIFLFVAPMVLFVGLWPIERSQKLVEFFLGAGNANWLKLVGTYCINLAFAASLVLLHRYISRREAEHPLLP